MGIIDSTICLLLFLSDISLLIEVDNDNEHNVMNKLNVGNTIIYVAIPVFPMALVKNIFIIIANNLVIPPPIIKIIVDLINLFFIFNYMFL